MSVSIRYTPIQFLNLSRGQRESVRADVRFRSDAVPDILDQLQTLVDGEVPVVKGWSDHSRNMRPAVATRKCPSYSLKTASV